MFVTKLYLLSKNTDNTTSVAFGAKIRFKTTRLSNFEFFQPVLFILIQLGSVVVMLAYLKDLFSNSGFTWFASSN